MTDWIKIIGLMSGTSMDGVDLSIISSDGYCEFSNVLDDYYEYDDYFIIILLIIIIQITIYYYCCCYLYLYHYKYFEYDYDYDE